MQGPIDLKAQDTLRVNLAEFIEQGIEKSGMVAYEQRATELAHNQADQAKAMRILPSINLNTQHGLIPRSEEHTSELQSRGHLVCRLLLEKKKKKNINEINLNTHITSRELIKAVK